MNTTGANENNLFAVLDYEVYTHWGRRKEFNNLKESNININIWYEYWILYKSIKCFNIIK